MKASLNQDWEGVCTLSIYDGRYSLDFGGAQAYRILVPFELYIEPFLEKVGIVAHA